MAFFKFTIIIFQQSYFMEAEQLNLIANRLSDLSKRNEDLRGYL